MRPDMSTKELLLDDGAATVVETWGERGPAIVCVHGMTSSRKAWMRLAERLDGRYRVVAYDQRGHGDAAHVRGPMRLDRHVADLRAVLREFGSDAIALLGHSWGGAVVVLAGADAPARGVIAIDPVLNVSSGTWRQDYLADAETLFALPWQARELSVRASLATWHPLDVDGKLHAVRNMTAEPIARLGTENSVDAGGWNILNAVENYPKPLLVFAAGPEDSVMSPADVSRLKTRGGRFVRVVEFPEEGHNLHRTSFDRYAAEVETFLADLEARG
jgi:pimeloyl-ACP methyl ester carboxylesterase